MSRSALPLPPFGDPERGLPRPAHQPLRGITVLVVEDSRFASEALRLLCLRSGARIRRADTIRAAMRHLMTYQPTVLMVDMGLPDGDGADLIARFAGAERRVPAILAISGEPGNKAAALAAGADAFLCKPIDNIGVFQQNLLACLPPELRPGGLHLVPDTRIKPNPLALHKDLIQVMQMLAQPPDGNCIDHIAGFLAGIACSARDNALHDAATALARTRPDGHSLARSLAQVRGLIHDRLVAGGQD